MIQAYNTPFFAAANAVDIVNNYNGTAPIQVPSVRGSGTSPLSILGQPLQPGDIFSLADISTSDNTTPLWSSSGHTEIVTGVSNVTSSGGGWIDVMDQNGFTNGAGKVYLNAWSLVDSVWPGHRQRVVDWLHDPSSGGGSFAPHNDFNGDRVSDVMGLYDLGNNTTGAYEWFGTGSASLSYQGSVWSSGGFTASKAKWVSGDFNEDGKADIIAMYDLGSPSPQNVPAVGAYEWYGTSTSLSYQYQIWSTIGLGGFSWASCTWVP